VSLEDEPYRLFRLVVTDRELWAALHDAEDRLTRAKAAIAEAMEKAEAKALENPNIAHAVDIGTILERCETVVQEARPAILDRFCETMACTSRRRTSTATRSLRNSTATRRFQMAQWSCG
jgi:hypothetical protein